MNIKDIGGLMKQAQALQEKMASMQQEAAEQVVIIIGYAAGAGGRSVGTGEDGNQSSK